MDKESKIDYVDFNDLPVLNEKEMTHENLNEQVLKLKEIPKWEVNFNAMQFMRSLNKQNNKLIKQVLPSALPFIEKLSNSIRSGVSKLSVILLGEILHLFCFESQNDYGLIYEMIKIVLHCSSSNKMFIKKDSLNILNYCAKFEKFQTFEFATILVELMRNDNATICDNCYEVFEGIQSFVTIDTNHIDVNVWKKFVNELENLYNKKKERYTKKCAKIINWLYDKIGIEQLKNILNQIELGDKFSFFEKCFNENSKRTTSTMSFRDFKKQKFSKRAFTQQLPASQILQQFPQDVQLPQQQPPQPPHQEENVTMDTEKVESSHVEEDVKMAG